MIIHGRKRFQFTLDLNALDRDELARELLMVLNYEDFKSSPKLQQLLGVVETVEHGASNGLDVQSDSEYGKHPT